MSLTERGMICLVLIAGGVIAVDCFCNPKSLVQIVLLFAILVLIITAVAVAVAATAAIDRCVAVAAARAAATVI